jgi:hypothetical protein
MIGTYLYWGLNNHLAIRSKAKVKIGQKLMMTKTLFFEYFLFFGLTQNLVCK